MLFLFFSVFKCSQGFFILLFSCSVVSNSMWPHGLQACQASLSFTISWSLLRLISIESVMSFNHLVLCRPLLLLPSIFPALGPFLMSQIFASGSESIETSASILALWMNIQVWLPLGLTSLISLLSKRRLSLLNHHSPKATVLPCSALFVVQLSHPYMTTGKTTVLTIQTFVSKMMSLIF